MRALVLLALIGAVATPAAACPKGAAGATRGPLYAVAAESPAHIRGIPTRRIPVAALRLPETARVRTTSPLQESLATFTPEEPKENEPPEIWKTLSGAVESGLPRVDKNARAVTMVFHPTMVSTPESTTPGLGVAGTFR